MKNAVFSLCFSVLFLISAAVYANDVKPPKSAVVSAHSIATQAGYSILEKGGNAFDAAVAVSAALGVVEPFGSGIGGGAFWLIYHAQSDTYLVIDARETAPLAAHADMYLDEQGNPIDGASTSGPLSAGIPGLPAAWVHVNKRFGTQTLLDVLTPAISAAQNGFEVDERYITGAAFKQKQLLQNQAASEIFLSDGNVPKKGWVLKQADLAQTLQTLGREGHNGFYGGIIAQKMVGDVRLHGGIWSLQDFENYTAKERSPIITQYKNAKIIAPPLPSSGGMVLANTFNILSGYDLNAYNTADQKHLIIEAMKHAYHNRAIHMGDEDFVSVPTKNILSMDMAKKQSAMITMKKSLPSSGIAQIAQQPPKGTETTHFAVMDKDGNRVAVTQSINFWFGSGFVAKGTGVLLNNEMDDFVIKPGVANGYGLVGTTANAIEPSKRMLSSMTPTFVEDEKGVLILGTPGGSRIISMNLLTILAYLNGEVGDNLVSAPRYHHQFLPDKVVYEEGAFNPSEIKALLDKGHVLEKSSRKYGNMQVIHWGYEAQSVDTFSDPRGHGAGRVY